MFWFHSVTVQSLRSAGSDWSWLRTVLKQPCTCLAYCCSVSEQRFFSLQQCSFHKTAIDGINFKSTTIRLESGALTLTHACDRGVGWWIIFYMICQRTYVYVVRTCSGSSSSLRESLLWSPYLNMDSSSSVPTYTLNELIVIPQREGRNSCGVNSWLSTLWRRHYQSHV